MLRTAKLDCLPVSKQLMKESEEWLAAESVEIFRKEC